MRILYFDFELPYLIKDADVPVGGAAVEWSNWIKGFKHIGSEVGVITWRGANEYVADTNIDFELLETFSPQEGIRYLRIFNVRLPRYIKAIKEFKPDVVIQGCASITTGLLCIASKIAGVPFVYRVANDMDADERHKQRMSLVEAKFYQYGIKHANAIICQNHYQQSKFQMKFPSKNITIIHNPYDLSKVGTENEFINQRKYIAWLGVFQSQKNLPALYKITQALPAYEFRIGGKSSSAGVDKDTKEALKNLENASNVKFEGYIKRTHISSFLSEAHLLLNTSHYEGFSNTFLESFASGTPIVTTRKVDPDHIIEKNGLGAVGDTYEDIPELIKSIVHHNSFADLSSHCKNFVKKNHDHISQASKFHEYLSGVINQQSPILI